MVTPTSVPKERYGPRDLPNLKHVEMGLGSTHLCLSLTPPRIHPSLASGIASRDLAGLMQIACGISDSQGNSFNPQYQAYNSPAARLGSKAVAILPLCNTKPLRCKSFKVWATSSQLLGSI